jgi:uncharacterized protein
MAGEYGIQAVLDGNKHLQRATALQYMWWPQKTPTRAARRPIGIVRRGRLLRSRDLTKITQHRGEQYLQAYMRDPSRFYDEKIHRRLIPTQDLSLSFRGGTPSRWRKRMNEVNKTVATKFLDALCAGDVERLKPLMNADIEAIAMGTGAISGTRRYDDIVKVASMFPLISKSGLNPKIVSLTAEDDRVAVEWEGYCTLVNGEQYNNKYTMIFFIRDGKVSKLHEYFCTKLADEKILPLLSGTG